MKIAHMVFQITKIGGIATVAHELTGGLNDLGHNVTTFYISKNKKKLPDPPDFADKSIGYMSDNLLSESIREISDFDLLIFDPPCPTITKSYKSRRWQHFYTNPDLPENKIVVTHDPFFKLFYPWLDEVNEHITGVAAVQKRAYVPLLPYFKNILITNHYVDLTDMGTYKDKKEDLTICPHQFRTWKHVDDFIRAIPHINSNAEVFNGGIEQCYMSGKKRKDIYKNPDGTWIWENALKNGMNYRGFVSNTEINDAYKRAKCVIDFSVVESGSKIPRVDKLLNYVPLLAMKYGAIPLVRKHSLLPPITEKNVVTIDEDDIEKSIPKKINEITSNFSSYNDMIKRNHKLLEKHYDRADNAKKLLSLIDKPNQNPHPVQESLF